MAPPRVLHQALLGKVLSPEGLDHIAGHKYVAGKYTPLDSLLNGWWLSLAESLPTWLAPNLVTLLGFVPMMLCYVLMWLASPTLEDPAPRWLAILTSLAVFFYQTMDAVDGKQARRTGSSTPLGQLFDHGCDCLLCISFHSVTTMISLPGGSLWGAAGLSALQSVFFMAQWQEYHTGVLTTSFGPVGVTETQFAAMALALAAGIVGPERLQAFITSKTVVPWSGEPQQNGVFFFQGFAIFMGVFMLLSMSKTLTTVVKTGSAAGTWRAVLQLTPVVMLNVLLFLVWDPEIYSLHARKVCFLTGLLFCFYTAQMILFSMAKMRFPELQLGTLVPYAALALSSRVLLAAQMDIALTLALVVVGVWLLSWFCRVINELKDKLGIYAFSLQKRSD